MSDLISKESLYKKIVEKEELARQRVLDTPTNSPCYQRYVAQLNERTAFKHMVFDEPTAYDVEKVVEQLESTKGMCGRKCCENVMGIVKAGGKE